MGISISCLNLEIPQENTKDYKINNSDIFNMNNNHYKKIVNNNYDSIKNAKHSVSIEKQFSKYKEEVRESKGILYVNSVLNNSYINKTENNELNNDLSTLNLTNKKTQ
jgi:hypothetical protein